MLCFKLAASIFYVVRRGFRALDVFFFFFSYVQLFLWLFSVLAFIVCSQLQSLLLILDVFFLKLDSDGYGFREKHAFDYLL